MRLPGASQPKRAAENAEAERGSEAGDVGLVSYREVGEKKRPDIEETKAKNSRSRMSLRLSTTRPATGAEDRGRGNMGKLKRRSGWRRRRLKIWIEGKIRVIGGCIDEFV